MPIVPTHSRNKPSLVAHDLRAHVPAGLVYDSLYKRGVLKLFFIREAARTLLDLWLRVGREAGIGAKNHSADYWKGYRQCAMDNRAELKRLLDMPKEDCPIGDEAIVRHMIGLHE